MQDEGLGSFLANSLRAHALQFERPLAPSHDAAVGRRILIAFVVVAFGVFYGLRLALARFGLAGTPIGGSTFVALLLAAFLVAQQLLVREPVRDIGLRHPSAWTRRERLYAVQVMLLALPAFAFVFRDHLRGLIALHGPIGFVMFSVLTGLVWGVVQEFLYRGWLQSELTRRFGGMSGLLLANLVFAFGPLHLDHVLAPGGPNWSTLAAIFGIGLLFGLIYRRSGNLWIPALLHGLWPLNMT
jgi:membrane protease YdiL (CAAX protease family)